MREKADQEEQQVYLSPSTLSLHPLSVQVITAAYAYPDSGPHTGLSARVQQAILVWSHAPGPAE